MQQPNGYLGVNEPVPHADGARPTLKTRGMEDDGQTVGIALDNTQPCDVIGARERAWERAWLRAKSVVVVTALPRLRAPVGHARYSR